MQTPTLPKIPAKPLVIGGLAAFGLAPSVSMVVLNHTTALKTYPQSARDVLSLAACVIAIGCYQNGMAAWKDRRL